MKKNFKISHIVRKRAALFLLLNFLYSTILFAVPTENCNGFCDVAQEIHTCSNMKMDIEESCCDMMGMNENNSKSCDMEFSDLSCDYEFLTSDSFTFIIPKTVDSKIVFTEISNIGIYTKQDVSKKFILSHDIIPDITHPIYLTVSSFLI